MNKLFYVLIAVLLVTSCSEAVDNLDIPEEGEGGGNENVEKPILKLELDAKSKQGNIFDPIILYAGTEKGVSFGELDDFYDSIMWKVNKLAGSHEIYKYTISDGVYEAHFVPQWSHHFSLPGKYETYLVGYKDAKVVYSDTLEIQITNNKDFLGYNWKDITQKGDSRLVYVDVLSRVYEFGTFQNIYQGTPSVELSLSKKKYNEEENDASQQESKNILLNYISALYKAPTYLETDPLLQEKYDQLFRNKQKDAYPQCIWLTPKARIVLLKCEAEWLNRYVIYAEPEGI